jgi:hypothetical protein
MSKKIPNSETKIEIQGKQQNVPIQDTSTL